eukprot:scaffold27209_cov126-Skeletonema_dohrnii-CCMP3373.AAC.1
MIHDSPRIRRENEMLLGKYNNGGEQVHVGNILGTRGKSPHILDRGGEKVHSESILATSGKSPHKLDEGGEQVHVASILATRGK